MSHDTPKSLPFGTTSPTSKGQITVPRAIRRKLGLQAGNRIDVYPLGRDRFVAQIRRPSRILEFAGDLSHLDHDEKELPKR